MTFKTSTTGEQPAGDGSKITTHTDLDSPTADRSNKAFTTLAAQLALRGHQRSKLIFLLRQPSTPRHCCPPTLADFVLDEADRMPCSPDYIAAALIVCLGSVIGARCGIKPKRRDDWIVTPNLFGGIVGDPSSKKSPALGTVTRFLDRLEAKEAEKLEDAKKIFAAETAAFEAHQSAVKASMKKGRRRQRRPPQNERRHCGLARPATPGRTQRAALQIQRLHGGKAGRLAGAQPAGHAGLPG
jgi:hypothetical protein